MTTQPRQRTGRRRRTAASSELVIILWRDIPAQVTATVDGRTGKALLPSRFQKAIDKAARVAGLTDRSDYLQQWRRETRLLDDDTDPESAAHDEASRLDTTIDREALAALVRHGGLARPGASP